MTRFRRILPFPECAPTVESPRHRTLPLCKKLGRNSAIIPKTTTIATFQTLPAISTHPVLETLVTALLTIFRIVPTIPPALRTLPILPPLHLPTLRRVLLNYVNQQCFSNPPIHVLTE